MTTVNKTTATPRKKAGKPKGKNYTPKQKASAMVVLDFFDGNVTRTAQSLNIHRKTLDKWRDELETQAIDVQKRAAETADVVFTLKKLVEALCVIVLCKAQDASIRDLYYLMGIILDKVENLSKVQMVQQAHKDMHPPAEALPPAPVRGTLPASVDAELQKARYEQIVDQVIAQSQFEGKELSREQAVAGIIEANPESRPYLM
jgi:transposase-like protein